jgi:FkbM family methyltransferase
MLKEFKSQSYASNESRTAAYLEKFNRDAVLRSLIVHPKPVIFDVGGYNGKSIVYMKGLFPQASITSFEPNPQVIDALQEIATKFSDVKVVNSAVSNTDGQIEYFQQGINPGLGGVYRRNLESKDSIDLSKLQGKADDEKTEYLREVNKSKLTVAATTLATYIKKNPIERLHLLKLDVQGHEPEVLEGSGNLLEVTDTVLTEISFYDFYEKRVSFFDIERVLLPFGFRLWDISHISKNPMNGRTDWVDVIYAKR